MFAKYLFTKRIIKSSSGFTLLEMLVVISVTGILLVMVSGIFVNILQTNVNVTVTNNVRQSGTFMMETLTRAVRSSDTVMANYASGTSTNSITLVNAGVATTYFFCNNNFYTNSTTNQINTSSIIVDSAADCTTFTPIGASHFVVVPANGTSPAKVTIYLNLKTANPGSHLEFVTSQNFTETVELRSYVR